MALAALLRDHEDAIEADLQRYYSVDIADLWRGGLTFRRLAVLVQHLPTDSATASAISGIPRDWSGTLPWLLDYIIQSLTGSPHPARPGSATSDEQKASRTAALLDHQRRMAERDAAFAQNT